MTLSLKLIGYPIEHSMSPWIHNEFLKRSNLEGSYELFEINPDENFENNIEKLKSTSLTGFNVTVPYKQRIMNFLDKVDDTANLMGAVNTVSIKDGEWVGYNTDGQGYLRSLYAAYPFLKGVTDKRVLILGAGGAARGIFHALVQEGYNNIKIANRTLSHAEFIVGTNKDAIVISLEEAINELNQFDLIIQTSAVGMNEPRSIIALDNLNEETVVSDIVYQPLETHFLQLAKQRTPYIHYGHTMLLYQAQAAFEIWTGTHVNVSDMDMQIEQILKGR